MTCVVVDLHILSSLLHQVTGVRERAVQVKTFLPRSLVDSDRTMPHSGMTSKVTVYLDIEAILSF